jgi:hypothetical protein
MKLPDTQRKWRAVARRLKVPVPDIPDSAKWFEEIRQLESANADKDLCPWLQVLDQGIFWFNALHYTLDYAENEEVLSRSARGLAAWTMTGYLATHAAALRWLCVQGLGAAAGGNLRSLIEATKASAIILGDEVVAKEYVAATEPPTTEAFWRKHLAGKKGKQAFRRALSHMPEELFVGLQEWFDQDTSYYSSFVHVGFFSSVLTARPLHFDLDAMPVGTLGARSVIDWTSLERASKVLWLAAMLIASNILGITAPRERLLGFDKSNELESTVVVGYYAFTELVLKYWETRPPRRIPARQPDLTICIRAGGSVRK